MTLEEIKDTLIECGYERICFELDSFVKNSTRGMAFDERVGFVYMVEDLITQSWEKYNATSIRPTYGVSDLLYSHTFSLCDAIGFHLAQECDTLIIHGSSLDSAA